MSNPSISQATLGPLALVSPAMVGQDLSIDMNSLDLTFDAPATVVALDVVLQDRTVTATSYVEYGGKRRFTASLANIFPSMVAIQVLVTGRDLSPVPEFDAVYGTTPTYNFRLIYTPVVEVLPVINPPSGVKIYKGLGTAKVEWVLPETEGLVGVRVQYSTDVTGINIPYAQWGALVTNVTRSENAVLTTTTSTAVVPSESDPALGVTTTTKTETTKLVAYSSTTFPQSVAGGSDSFYVVLSTVIQDPLTNHMYESAYNGPFLCGFVDLRQVSPSDFPYLQQKEDIASRLITSATRNYPDLDLTPRSELRDLHIDPISIELSNQSVREWFARCSESISAMATIDDYNGDGFSDTTSESPYKAQISRAWSMSSGDTQILIDRQFDILGETRAGLARGPSTKAIAMVTIYTYSRPTVKVSLSEGDITVGSVGDANTPSLSFSARGSAIVDPQGAAAIYDPVNGWWGVQIPVECTSSGSIGNVGSGTITQNLGGIPSGWFCINQSPAQYGTDRESNAKFAERIRDRMVVGVDTGRRLGYLNTARQTPGVVGANVVASGDLMMLRDWFPATSLPGGKVMDGKHIYGTVDVYVRGTDFIQQTDYRAFTWMNTAEIYRYIPAYSILTLIKELKAATPNALSTLALKVTNTLAYPLYSVAEIFAVRGNDQFLLGTRRARVNADTQTVYLDPTEECYKIIGDQISEHYETFNLNGVVATNQLIINYLSTSSGSAEYRGFLRLRSPIVHVPKYQPVTSVYSVTGEDNKTSAILTQNIRLIRHEDPLLIGRSNKATDTVQVDSDKVTAVTQTMMFATGGLGTLLIDSDVQVKMDTQGRIFGINSVRSEDLSTLYSINTDYTIVPTDRNNTYSITRPSSSRIPLDANILVSYNKYLLHEYCVRVDQEVVGFIGTAPSTLAHSGFVHNVWMPEYYGDTTLSLDGWQANPINYPVGSLCDAKIPKPNRYIKVTYDNGTGAKVMVENRDYYLTVDSATGDATLTRIMTGRIPDGGAVSVTYFYNETFSITTGYPGFVEQVAYTVEQTRHAAADVVVKQMIENPVDVILTVELNSNTTPEIMDGRIRTAIGNVLSNVRTKITQAEIIRQVKSLNGVANVNVPLTKFAKSDGALDIGHIITTGTEWVQITENPEFSSSHFPQGTWISKKSLLEDKTIPSGGLADEYVGLLYEGELYRRGMSIQDFIANPPTEWSGSFYIIGEDDEVDSLHPLDPAYTGRIILVTPKYFTDPSVMNFKVTYQVFREGGAKDITLSPTEFLKAGRITIDYV